MQIKVERFALSAGKAERYIISVCKRNGRRREYVVEINPLHRAMHFLFTDRWPRHFVENFAWIISFYPHDALFLPGEGGRFQPDSRMHFTRGELEKLIVQGIGTAIAQFSRRHHPMLLVAVAVRENLGKLYHRLLVRHAAAAGYLYHQTYVQEALYVIETERKPAESAGQFVPASQRRNYRSGAGLYA